MARTALAKFGVYLSNRRNFIKTSTAMFGIPFGIWMLWFVGAVGGPGWWLFVAIVSLAAGWLWGYLMWFVVKNDFQRIAAANRRNPEDPANDLGA
jgi:uncharacterized membrane protein